jgi:tryptophan-rich sensory protein
MLTDASSLLAFLGFTAACFLAAMTGAFFRPGEWYERLKKPSWRPLESPFRAGVDGSLCDDRCTG